jgi:hypothetical protein
MPATYSILRQDCRFEHYTALLAYGVECDALKRGLPLSAVEEPVKILLSAYGTYRCDVLELPCFVVSDAVRAAFDRVGVDNIEYFKAELQLEYSEQIIRGYWVANVIGRLSCVDELRSVREGDPIDNDGRLLSFHVDPARTCGLSLFRLAEAPELVMVHPRVRAALEATAGLRGLLFQEPSAYDGYPVDTSRTDRSANDAR